MSEPKAERFEICYWGTRGTLPAPGKQFLEFGGNTNCTQVTCGDTRLIFDAGTGIRDLGGKLAAENDGEEIHLFLTHGHYDHIEGLPFFAPFFSADARVNIYCGPLDGSDSTRDTVLNLMRRPYFPVGPDVFAAKVNFVDLEPNSTMALGPVTISTLPLNHPGGATGYRVDFDNRSFGCITDTEHVPGKIDESIVQFIDQVDHFLYDASLTEEEYPEFAGYGHSTFEEGMRLCAKANAKGFSAFHHMPFRTDAELLEIEKAIKAKSQNSSVAREGEIILL